MALFLKIMQNIFFESRIIEFWYFFDVDLGLPIPKVCFTNDAYTVLEAVSFLSGNISLVSFIGEFLQRISYVMYLLEFPA